MGKINKYNVLKRIKEYADSNGNYYEGLDEKDIQEIEEMQIKSKAFDEILNIQKRAEEEVWETDEWEDEIERVIGEHESGDPSC